MQLRGVPKENGRSFHILRVPGPHVGGGRRKLSNHKKEKGRFIGLSPEEEVRQRQQTAVGAGAGRGWGNLHKKKKTKKKKKGMTSVRRSKKDQKKKDFNKTVSTTNE